MNPRELEHVLAATLADRRLSRSERRALSEILQDDVTTASERRICLHEAFQLAKGELTRHADREVLDWLYEVVKVILAAAPSRDVGDVSEALFAPADDLPSRLRSLLSRTRSSLDVCVFTITDNSVTNAILDAHRRGVAVRILTDDDKAFDPGSDVFHLSQQGVPVRMDACDCHMHHKFALFDGRLLLSGSYNWTRGAAERNYENFLISDDRRLIERFHDEFENLWQTFAPR